MSQASKSAEQRKGWQGYGLTLLRRIGRQRADWLVGMNVSHTLQCWPRCRLQPHSSRWQVIPPQPSLLFVNGTEDRQFSPHHAWTLGVNVSVQNGQFAAQWIPPEECSDEQGRCVNKAYAGQVASSQWCQCCYQQSRNQTGKVSPSLRSNVAATIRKQTMGYTRSAGTGCSSKLCTRRTKATTYPRADSRYLPGKGDIPDILRALILSDQNVSGLVARRSSSRSGVFNDAKVTAHPRSFQHQPEQTSSAMSKGSSSIFDAIPSFHHLTSSTASSSSPKPPSRCSVDVTSLRPLVRHLYQNKAGRFLFASIVKAVPRTRTPTRRLNKSSRGLAEGRTRCSMVPSWQSKMTQPAPHFTRSHIARRDGEHCPVRD